MIAQKVNLNTTIYLDILEYINI